MREHPGPLVIAALFLLAVAPWLAYWCQPHPERARGLVLSRHCTTSPGWLLPRYAYSVTVRTEEGKEVRLRVPECRFGGVQVYDVFEGEVEDQR